MSPETRDWRGSSRRWVPERSTTGCATTPTWQRLNPVLLNASVSKLTVGRRGTTAVSFNEHGHLPPDLLTYR